MGALKVGLLVAVVTWAGCEDDPPLPPRDPMMPTRSTAPSASTSASTSAAAARVPAGGGSARRKKMDLHQQCKPVAKDAARLAIKEFVVTSKLEKGEPVDDLVAIRAGTKSYAFMVVRNRDKVERCIRVTIRIGGAHRASLTLPVGPSPSWRTRAHLTPRKSDVGKRFDITVTDDQGHEHITHSGLIE